MAALHSLPPLVVVLLASSVCWGWKNLPVIPANRRVEYYLLHDDGAYKFGYDTGHGASAVVSADPANQVQGQYSYVDNKGQSYSLSYTAGDGGFVPQSASGHSGGDVAGTFGTGAANRVAVASSGSDVDADYDANADASYSFSIDTDSYKRTESADARGNVRGQYSYMNGAGGQSVSYIAGEGTGFVVSSSDGSSGAPSLRTGGGSAPLTSGAQGGVNSDGTYSFSYNTADQSRQEFGDANNNVRGSYSFKAKDDGKIRRVDYEAGAATGFLAKGAHLPVAPAVPALGGYSAVSSYSGVQAEDSAPGDASYSFSYDAADHSRQEASDGQGNVKGQFSFLAKDGVQRRVEYEAGAEKGFIAKGAHLPVAPSASAGADASAVATYSGYSSAGVPSSSYSVPQNDGSYSFSYSAPDHSRQESADAQNNVRGSFSYTAKDDNKLRRVDYEAGAATGFIARGDHLPMAPNVGSIGTATGYSGTVGTSLGTSSGAASYSALAPSADGAYSFSYSAADHSRDESADAQNNVRGSYSFTAKDDGKLRRVDYEAGAATGFVARGDHLPVAPSVGVTGAATGYGGSGASSLAKTSAGTSYASSGPVSDGSYSFSYSAADHSREESADGQNNVRGSYSFTPKDDGKLRRVDYEAGAATGFVARGDHLPVAPSVGGTGAATGYSSSGASSLAKTSAATSYSSSGPASDGAYSFSYSAGDHSREESADAQNNVRGSYSFTAKDDGQTRRVEYVAGSGTGFLAKGAHLPVPPSLVVPVVGVIAPPVLYSAPAAVGGAASGDGSYSFSYDAGDHSRQESADALGNVRGSFSFVAKDDGVQRRVDYEAGAEKGFIAKGAHLPVTASEPVAALGGDYQAVVTSAAARSGSDEDSGDASYSYSYETDSSSKQESSDAAGNVKGSFTFLGGDGLSRTLHYTSLGDEGFLATGQHLPKPVSVARTPSGAVGSATVSARVEGGAVNKLHDLATSSFVLHKFLPPESTHKFGYIFDTKV